MERALDAGGSPGTWTEIASLSVSNTSYAYFSDTNVLANSVYWYRVRAYNVLGFSDYSSATSVNLVPPNAPNALNAAPFADRVNLNWNAGSGGAMGFKLERAPDANGAPDAWAQIAKLGPSSLLFLRLYYTDTNRAADTTYWYRVRAFNWIGDSPYSDPAVVTIVPPAAPSNLAAAIGNTNQVALSWYDSATDEDGFTVERAPDIGGSPGAWTQLGNTYYSSYTDTNATANTTNWYRVRAFNALGVSDYSAAASIYLVPPGAPTSLNATPVVDQVNLNWNAASGSVMGFKIERAPDADGTPGAWAQIAKLAPSSYYSTDFTDTNRAADTTYWYRVRAFNWIGDSPYSDQAVVTIVPPATPANLNAGLGTTNQVVLSWYGYVTDGIMLDGFTVERALDIGGGPGAWTQLAVINSRATNNGYYIDPNVTAYSTNWYRIRAFNVVGVSDYAEPVSVGVVPPVAPILSANADSGRANLTWYDSDPYPVAITSFQIERAPDAGGKPGGWAQIATVSRQQLLRRSGRCGRARRIGIAFGPSIGWATRPTVPPPA